MQPGERVTLEITGTVITDEEFVRRAIDAIGHSNDRQFSNVLLDNGTITRVDITSEDNGVKVSAAKPKYWPPVPDDAWVDDEGNYWYAKVFDFGNRKGLRLRKHTDLGEVLRSAQWFLDNNVSPVLMIRNQVWLDED